MPPMCNFTSSLPGGRLTRRFLAGNGHSGGAVVSSGAVCSASASVGTEEGSGVDRGVVLTSDSVLAIELALMKA